MDVRNEPNVDWALKRPWPKQYWIGTVYDSEKKN
jgi:hypothetical protein